MQKCLNYTKLFKILLIILLLTCLTDTFGQVKDPCKDFKTVFKKVNKYYAELSQKDPSDYIILSMKKADTINVKLFDSGAEVFDKDYISSDSATYLIKFFTKKCHGIYSLKIADTFFKFIKPLPEEFISKPEIKNESYSSNLDTVWERHDTETVPAAIHFPEQDNNLTYTCDLIIRFNKNKYTIVSEKSDQYSTGKRTRVYEGDFTVCGDTLRLFENNKVVRTFQFTINKENLVLADFVTIDPGTGYKLVPMDYPVYRNSGINLRGKYQKSSESK